VIFLDFLLALKKYNSIKIDFGYYIKRNYVGKEKFKAPFIVDVSFPYSNILNDIAPHDFERLSVRIIISAKFRFPGSYDIRAI
jgi:hypothetical protein